MTKIVSERRRTRKADELQETPDHREIEEAHRNVIIFVSDGLAVKNGRCDGANAPGPMTASRIAHVLTLLSPGSTLKRVSFRIEGSNKLWLNNTSISFERL